MARDGGEGWWRLRGEEGRRGGQGVECGGGQGTRTGSSRRRNEEEQQKTEQAEGVRQTKVAIGLSLHLKRRRSERDWRGIVARGGGEGRWRLKGEGGRIEGQGVEGGGGQGMRTRSSRRC